VTYLDYQATTPLAPEVLEAMLPWLRDQHANPHSAHGAGRRAKAVVEVARGTIDLAFVEHGEIAFTSGATEALNWAIKGSKGPIVTIATEHAAVLDTVEAEQARGREVIILPVREDGLVDLDHARAAIRPGTGLVAAMLVNNEIGVIQPIAELADLAHEADALMLCDAVQGFGRESIPPKCDLVAMSAHKIHGPKGIGALWLRKGVNLDPLLHGGGQETPGRSGTLSPALCAGFGKAAAMMREEEHPDDAHVTRLWDVARSVLSEGWIVNGSTEYRYRGNFNVRFPGLDVNRLMSDLRDIAFSAGSACASGSGRSSHVLRAIGLSEAEAHSSVRIGFGRYTSEGELIDALTRIDAAARTQRVVA
jgi:cysteine desulfurase